MFYKQSHFLYGAICGDIIGSVYEGKFQKEYSFPLIALDNHYTDDTVLTIAVADALIKNITYKESFLFWANKYPYCGYGSKFKQWFRTENPEPYNSYGNGSAMRVSPIAFAYNSLGKVLSEAVKSAEVTHNHLEGVRGAQAVAAACYLANAGKSKENIKNFIEKVIGYNLRTSLDGYKEKRHLSSDCMTTVPQAIVAFLESSDYESAIRNSILIGGDSDTIASISGSIAASFYKYIPDEIVFASKKILPIDMLEVILNFDRKFANQEIIEFAE